MISTNARQADYPPLQTITQQGKQLGKATRLHSWAHTGVGQPEQWPAALYTSLGIILPSGVPMAVFWGNDCTVFYNDAFAALMQWQQPATALGKAGDEVWAGCRETIERWLAANSSNETPLPNHNEYNFFNNLHKGNHYRNIHLFYTPVYHDHERIGGVMLTVTPITENDRRIQQLEEDCHRFKTLFDEATVGTALYEGADLVLKYANSLMLRYWGKNASVIGKKLKDVLPELEGQQFFPLLHQVYTSGEQFTGREMRADLEVDGKICPMYFNFTYKPLRDTAGRVYAIQNMAIDVTEQVLSKRKMQVAEQKHMLAIESADLGVYELTYEDNYLVTDDRFNRIWGKNYTLSREEYAQRIHPADREARRIAHERSLETGYLNYECRIIWDDGSEHWMKAKGKVIYDEDNKPVKLLGVVQDITEQVISQRRIAESERNMRNMILQAPVAMCVFRGPQMVVETVNPYMAVLWGKTAGEMVGKPVFDGLPEVRDQGLEALLQQVYATGEKYVAHERPVYLPRNNRLERLLVDFVYEPLVENNQVTGIIAVAVDVTQQVTARQVIEEAQKRAQLAVDMAELGIYDLNLETAALQGDKRFLQIVDEEAVEHARVLYSKLHPGDRSIPAKALAHARATGSLDFEARIILANGHQRWIRVKGNLLFEDRQKPVRLFGVVQDVTKQREFAAELELKVVERTRELAEANYQLQQSNIELNQFAYIASHDLQEPLRKVRTFTNMMASELQHIPERAAAFMARIHDSTERMQTLINDVLRFSQLSKERETYETVNLATVMQRILDDYELLIEQKNAHITVQGLPILEANPLQMTQLLTNLLSNALKFNSGNRPLKISIQGQPANAGILRRHPELHPTGRYFVVSFTDNGIGFSQEYAQQIFTIFQRLHGKKEYSGTGIGLAMCKKIVQNHHGAIYATSQPTVGSTFTIVLPATQAGAVHPPQK